MRHGRGSSRKASIPSARAISRAFLFPIQFCQVYYYPKFQGVSFDALGGFDDIVETSIDLPPNTNADFAVINPPSEVYWYNVNGKQTVKVPLKDAKTANDNTIKVVDLDPWSPFHAQAAMAFPVDDWTEKVFGTVNATQNSALLGTYVNFGMIRWIRPENIHLLRFL